MVDIRKQLELNIHELKKAIHSIERYLEESPPGHMQITKRGEGSFMYYHVLSTKDDMQKGISSNYEIRKQYLRIRKAEDERLIRQLAQKSYYYKLVSVLRNELKVLQDIIKVYDPAAKNMVYAELSNARKQLVKPAFMSVEEKVSRWENQEWEPCAKYPENLKYQTNHGEYVRSKSEVIIADILDKNSQYCSYRYECPLYLQQSGIMIYPDFTIINKLTGNIFYWEHLGVLGNEQYTNDSIKKINHYIAEGIMPGENLIITYESDGVPLDINVVRKLVDRYFVKS